MSWNGPRLFRLFVHPVLCITLPTPCSGCGALLGAAQESGYCPGCWSALEPGRAGCRSGPVCAAVRYDGLARTLLLEAKFHQRPELFQPLGRRMAAIARACGIDRGLDLVLPVPSHPLTRIRRGYNPAGELARAVASCLGLPVARWGLRRRFSHLAPVKTADRKTRQAAAVAGFLACRGRFSRRRILLVDDIVTTGATYHGCRSALLAAGASVVRLLVWARTPGGTGSVAGGAGAPYNEPHPGYIV